jgi:shikimate kinase
MPGPVPFPQRLTLIGYRACGKTTVGRLVAERLDRPFIDADRALEHELGETISTWFPAHGEAAFRDRESACLAQLLAGDAPLVLSTGGGAVLRPANRELLRTRGGTVLFLDCPAAVLRARLLKHAGNRPSLTGLPIADEVERLLGERLPLYQAIAHEIIDATQTPAAIADDLAHRFQP